MRRALAAFAFCALAQPLSAQNTSDGLAIGRKMLAEDNPGELWLDRGQQLLRERRGPKKASLEACDLGLGAGKLEGAAARWPAYRGAHAVVRTMQWRLYDCFWQMRLPELQYVSDVSIALTTYLHYQGKGAVIRVPGFKR